MSKYSPKQANRKLQILNLTNSVYLIGILFLGLFYYYLEDKINNDTSFILFVVIYVIALRVLGYFVSKLFKQNSYPYL